MSHSLNQRCALPDEKRLCVFDFDGTLVDSMQAFAVIAGRVIAERYSVPEEKARSLYRLTSGVPFFEQLEILFPGDPHNHEACRAFEQEKLVRYFDHPLFEGVPDLFDGLRERGVMTAISSNNYENLVSRFVREKGFTCDFVLGYRPNFAKGLSHFNYLQEKLGLKASEILFVGDSLKDGELAYRASVDFVAKIGTFSIDDFRIHFPDVPVISDLRDLTSLLD